MLFFSKKFFFLLNIKFILHKIYKMNLEKIIENTKALKKEDFLIYIFKLQKFAKKEYDLNIFLDNFNKNKKKREPGFLKGEFYMSEDFDAPMEDFKNYM